jgi:uncharacterized membrane protein YkoI
MKSWKAGMMSVVAVVGGLSTQALAKDREVKQSEVPAAVMKTVTARYPNAQPSRFSTESEEGKTVYEVNLDVGGRATELSVAADGTVVSEEQRLEVGELPASVKSGLSSSSFAQAKILRAEKEQKGGATNYELLIEQGGKRSELVFNAEGKLVTTHEKSVAGKEKGHEADEGD